MKKNLSVSAKFFSALGIAVFAMFLGGCDERPEAAPELISAFQNSCPSKGRWTDAALGHNTALIGALERMKQRDPCKKLAGTLTQVQGISQKVEALLKNPSFSNYRTEQENLQLLTLALQGADPNDADLVNTLKQALAQSHVDLSRARAEYNIYDSKTKKRDHYAIATNQLSSYMQDVALKTSGLTECLNSNPGAAVQLFSQLLGMAGSFIAPVFGAATQAVGQLVSVGVEYLRDKDINDGIWDLYRNQMPIAVMCGYESMTELFCDAEDASDLLDFQNKMYPNPTKKPVPLWQGLDILGTRLPVVTRWLNRVRNGLPASNPIEANERNLIWRKVEVIGHRRRSIEGEVADTTALFRNAVSGETKKNLTVNLILSIVGNVLGNGNGINPFREVESDAYQLACQFSKGTRLNCPEPNPDRPVRTYIQDLLLPGAGSFLEPSVIDSYWQSFLKEVEAQVDVEFSTRIILRPESLVKAAQKKDEIDNVRPVYALRMIEGFLVNVKDYDDDAYLRSILKSIRRVISVIDKAVDPDEPKKKLDPIGQIRKIFEIFDLRNGTKLVEQDVINFVEWDVQWRLENGEIPKNVKNILMAAGGELRRRLTDSGTSFRGQIFRDLNRAKTITEGNLDVFNDVFDGQIEKAIEYLYQKAKHDNHERDRHRAYNSQNLAELCIFALTAGREWPEDIPWKYCKKSVYYDPLYKPGRDTGLSLRLSDLRKELKGVKRRTRMCTFHNFMRKSRLSEILDDRKDAQDKKKGKDQNDKEDDDEKVSYEFLDQLYTI